MTSYPKNKDTLFSSTLKVEEKEVYSDFHLVAFSQSYGHIEVLPIWPFLGHLAIFKAFEPPLNKLKIQ